MRLVAPSPCAVHEAGTPRVGLLGPPIFARGDRWIPFRTRKALALVAYLAVERWPQPRDVLAALLWPESTQEAARTMLRSAIASARRALGDMAGATAGRLVAVGDAVALDLAEVDLDLGTLGRATRAARAAPVGQGTGIANAHGDLLSTLRSGIAAYRGGFLAGFSLPDTPEFEVWVVVQREAWPYELSVVFARLVPLLAARGEGSVAVTVARRWVAHDPFDESAHRALMLAHAHVGDRPAAIIAFERCRTILDDELGVAPATETASLAERLRRATLPMPRQPPPGAATWNLGGANGRDADVY